MLSPHRPSSKPEPGLTATKLAPARSSLKRAHGRGLIKLWAVRLLVALAVLLGLVLLSLVVVRVTTTQMWFDSVRHGSVYRTMIEVQVLLFCAFAATAGLVSGATIQSVRRNGSLLPFSQDDDTLRWVFRKYEPRLARAIVLLVVVVPGVVVGRSAAAGWQTYLLWRHATPWHATDPLFHRDVSFFVEINPFHVMVVGLLMQAVTYALWIAVVAGYWYGAWRLRGGTRKITGDFTRLVSLLLAAYLMLKAVSYWLSRYALTTSQRGPVTGSSYTDVHTALPSKYALVVIALACAVVLVVNAFRGRRFAVAAGAVALAAIALVVVGTAVPGLVYRFRESPSAARLDLTEISRNQQATLAAFNLAGSTTTVPYDAPTNLSSADLVKLSSTTAQLSDVDPNQLSPTFNVEQQLQAFYGFKSTLDVGNYTLDGKAQDVVIAARELRASGIPQSTWVNNHLVYTHGYGVVATPTDGIDPASGTPAYLNGGIPPAQDIPVSQPDVYFSQALGASTYAIVGQPSGSKVNLEFDHPGSDGSSASAYTTYTGDGGVPIGSALRRLLFAVQLRDPNILFSSELNSASQLLTQRDPRARVAKVAPWLTLDGDVYPAVVNGGIDWVVDGYTSSASYPNSQLVNLQSATKTTLVTNGATIAQPSTKVNYLQNSVKAVVNAYTGAVTLYEWDQAQHPDPLLKSWESVYPGLVQAQSSIPSALLPALRYPTDLFNVQRYLLTKYHVTEPASFYSGGDFWTVPTDPTVAAAQTLNASTTTPVATSSLPSRYASMSADGFGAQRYSLSSPMVTLNGQQLAAFVSVDARPGPDYGKFTVLEFPGSTGGESPAQVQNDIESNTTITEALTLQRGGNSKVVLGDLQSVPVGGRLLYIEPVYTQSNGSASFPILRHVIALYANGDPSFENTLESAVQVAIQSASG